MKKLLFATILISTFLFACNGDKIADLEKRNKALTEQSSLQDSLLNDFLKTLNEFEDNLAFIKEKESLISMETADNELAPDQKERILADIQMINELIDQNRSLIDELSAKVETSDGRVRDFRRMVSRLRSDLKDRDEQIENLQVEMLTLNEEKATLRSQVVQLAQSNDELKALSEAQSEVITSKEEALGQQEEKLNFQSNQMNQGFYVVGTEKELREMQVLERKGGIIGIGRTSTLSENFDPAAFTEINITDFQSLPIDTRKMKIVTTHPTGSYAVNETDKGFVESLEITDPDRFWQATRYLVVVRN